jgi:hypothetical protein
MDYEALPRSRIGYAGLTCPIEMNESRLRPFPVVFVLCRKSQRGMCGIKPFCALSISFVPDCRVLIRISHQADFLIEIIFYIQ